MAAARGPGAFGRGSGAPGAGSGAPGAGPGALGATGAFGGPDRRGAMGSPDRFAGLAAALVLGDGRFPAGGHAHSGGVEEAAAQGLVGDLPTLGSFLAGRLETVGLVSAALGAAACAICLGAADIGAAEGGVGAAWARAEDGAGATRARARGGARAARARAWAEPSGQVLDDLFRLDREADARMPAPAQRRISRSQGRQLLRATLVTWQDGLVAAVADAQPEPHHPLALGCAAVTAGMVPGQAAACLAYGAVAGPAWAAVRLLGMNPLAVAALVADLASRVDQVAAEAAACVPQPGDELAAWGWMARLPAASAPLLDHLAESHAVRKMRLFAS